MKRSRSIRLVLLGSTSLLMLAGCDQPDPLARNDFFQNEQQCARVNDADACRQALMDAQREHQRTAPAFASREACEERFGAENCAETKQPPAPAQVQGQAPEQQRVASGGGSWFMPLMMGYMMGNMMSGSGLGSAPGQQQASAAARPVYRDANNTVYSGGQTLGQTRIAPPPRPATTVARGGFGRTGTGSVSS